MDNNGQADDMVPPYFCALAPPDAGVLSLLRRVLPISSGALLVPALAANLAGDGTPELVLNHPIRWLRLQADGSLAGSVMTVPASSSCNTLAVGAGDFNRDGKQDLLLLCSGQSQLVWIRNGGDGSFSTEITVANFGGAISDARAIHIVDMNNDNAPDVVVLQSSTVYLLTNSGNGGSFTKTTLLTGATSDYVEVADVDMDSQPDLVFAVANTWHRNTAMLLTAMPLAGVASGVSQTMVDIDNDSDPDIVSLRDHSTLEVYINNGIGHFSLMGRYPTQRSRRMYVTVGDVNGDGHPDVLLRDDQYGSVSWFPNAGDGRLLHVVHAWTSPDGNAQPVSNIVVADLTGDGVADAVFDTGGAQLSILKNTEPEYVCKFDAGQQRYTLRALEGDIAFPDVAPGTYYPDADGDGFGATGAMPANCPPTASVATDRDDCDDGNANIHPDAQEVAYNGLDDDCSAETYDIPIDICKSVAGSYTLQKSITATRSPDIHVGVFYVRLQSRHASGPRAPAACVSRPQRPAFRTN